MSGQTGIIPTGVYTVTNARYQNNLELTDNHLAGNTIALGTTLLPSNVSRVESALLASFEPLTHIYRCYGK